MQIYKAMNSDLSPPKPIRKNGGVTNSLKVIYILKSIHYIASKKNDQ